MLMKKTLWIILILIVILMSWWFIVKETNWLWWFNNWNLSSAEKWLTSQTGDIFTLENLPYIQELTIASSGVLAQYIKTYVDTLWILAQTNQVCPKTNAIFYLWDNFICFKEIPLRYNTGFWNLWTWDLNYKTPFIEAFNQIIASIWYISLSSFNNNLSIDVSFNADPKSFKIIGYQYAKDDKNIYIFNTENSSIYTMNWADTNTFEVLNSSGFTAKDKNYVYYRDKANTWIDTNSFQVLNGRYSKDKNYVYYLQNRINWADSATFIVTTSWNQVIGKDKNDTYINGMTSQEYAQLYPEFWWEPAEIFNAEPTEFSYTKQDDIIVVKNQNRIIKDIFTPEERVSARQGCYADKSLQYFKNLLLKFSKDEITQYRFLYSNKRPTQYDIDLNWTSEEWRKVYVLPNRAGYKTADEFIQDFWTCGVSQLIPALVWENYILFIDGCWWAWEPFGCSDINNRIQKTIKLK